jgi:hypothetical protein
LSETHGFGRIEVANRSMIGFCRIYLNEARLARAYGDTAVRAAALVGQPRAELLGEILGAFISCELRDAESFKSHFERSLLLSRQLGARRFEAQALELQGRVVLDMGRRGEAESILREALAICRDAGTQFCGPKVASALSRTVEDRAERVALLVEGADMLRRGAVSHNHLWYHRDAIEVYLADRDAEGMMRHVAALEAYTSAEPLPWADLFAARGRALAASLTGGEDEKQRVTLVRLRDAVASAGFAAFAPALEAALAGLG